ncbi:autoinducer binding domain-containing protein [Rhizobium sp. NFR03]|uniref:helix-turn-helix transcriptional regulator n=1 Tax=Rhizobium sp. NFR03 TaxID=1566263 RepID=UPI0008D46F20|nr:autoinducer binding domain-containing protein [Rhizobium sp. NFR03]SES41373.1 DNA-binding transcriptional regulator, CsgD family [Rhizobium sp. NFR03]
MRLHLSLEDIRDTKHRGEIESLLRVTCARYDVSHATFLALRSKSSSKHDPFYFTTYPKAWVDTYVARNFFELDPLIAVSLAGLLPVDWESVDRTDRKVSLFFEEALSHGIGPNGLTFPIRGPYGERAFFSVSSHLTQPDWADLRALIINDLHVLSYYLHETILGVTGLRPVVRSKALSRREKQCLELLAAGQIHKQIAASLEISESSVRLYLRTARHKLGALTSHHAVARATILDLINI